MSVAGELRKVLSNLKASHNVEACAVVSKSGIPIAWDVPDQVHLETFATLSATILGASDVVCSGLNKEPPERVIIEGKDGLILVRGLDEKVLLVAMTRSQNTDGLIAGLNEAAENIKEVLIHERG